MGGASRHATFVGQHVARLLNEEEGFEDRCSVTVVCI